MKCMGRAWQCCVTQPRFCCCLLSPKHSLNHFSCVVSHCCQLLPLHGMLGVLFMFYMIFARIMIKVLNNRASTRMTIKDKRRGIRPRAVKKTHEQCQCQSKARSRGGPSTDNVSNHMGCRCQPIGLFTLYVLGPPLLPAFVSLTLALLMSFSLLWVIVILVDALLLRSLIATLVKLVETSHEKASWCKNRIRTSRALEKRKQSTQRHANPEQRNIGKL